MPLFRFRTGDLSMMEHAECECGYEVTLPRGVFGRVDNMVKIKGLRYILLRLASFSGVTIIWLRVLSD